MEVEYARRGVANAGLTTGIIGTALGALNGLGGMLGGRVVNALKDNAIVKTLGVITEDGAVDVDTLKEAAMEQVKKQGFAEIGGIPIIKKITFRAEDVEKLYHYIVEG